MSSGATRVDDIKSLSDLSGKDYSLEDIADFAGKEFYRSHSDRLDQETREWFRESYYTTDTLEYFFDEDSADTRLYIWTEGESIDGVLFTRTATLEEVEKELTKLDPPEVLRNGPGTVLLKLGWLYVSEDTRRNGVATELIETGIEDHEADIAYCDVFRKKGEEVEDPEKVEDSRQDVINLLDSLEESFEKVAEGKSQLKLGEAKFMTFAARLE